MKQQWLNMSDKFLQLTSREQFLLLITGLVAIFFLISYLFIDDKSAKVIAFEKQSKVMVSGNKTLNFSITEYQSALEQDPNLDTINKIAQLEAKLAKIDSKLVHLTTELISPSEMREALLKLLNLEPGVSLLSFELIGAQPLLALSQQPSSVITGEANAGRANTDKVSTDNANNTNNTNNTSTDTENILVTDNQLGLNLYKHGIKIKLSGNYFQLRNYLQRLEQLSWKFFWQDFQFEVKEYPSSEVDITIYSLGLNKEFIGV